MKRLNFKKESTLTIVALLLITLGFTARLLPHPANFTPIAAIALFGALYLPKRWSIVLPLGAMLLSDALIGFYSWKIMLAVYLGFAIMGIIGLMVRKNKRLSTIVGGTLLGSVIFFLATNAAVWIFGTMYAPNFSGLMQSYYLALPFFRNSLLGNFFYVTLLVGGMETLLNWKNVRGLSGAYRT